jgi:hypothetical protein
VSKHILHDRSRCVADWKCPRFRYLGYELDGKGITSETTALELYLGQAIHDGLAAIATAHQSGRDGWEEGQRDLNVPIDIIATTAAQQVREALMVQSAGEDETIAGAFAQEQAALVEGLLRGFYIHVWPRLMAQYPQIVLIEQECTYDHHGMTFMARPDLVLADAEGNLTYTEYKSTSSKREEWINSWATAVQLHSSIKAIEQTLARPVSSVVVQGLYKGYISYGKQNSPLCYGYFRGGNPPFTQDSMLYEYKAGYKRFPTWEMAGGVKRWVEAMPENILADQFPQTPPIYINEDLIVAFFEQRACREKQIDLALQMMEDADEETKEAVLNTAFDQHWEQCAPSFGHPCPFRRICFGQVTEPLKQGFIPRTAHHQLELDTQESEPSNL